MIVRKATIADVPWALSELDNFSNTYSTKLKMFPASLEAAISAMSSLIENHLVLISESDKGDKCGLIGGVVTPHYFNPDIKLLAELFWWVSEQHRGSRAGAMLFKEYMKQGAKMSDWITFTLRPQSPVKEEFLIKQGFSLSEKNFIMEAV